MPSVKCPPGTICFSAWSVIALVFACTVISTSIYFVYFRLPQKRARERQERENDDDVPDATDEETTRVARRPSHRVAAPAEPSPSSHISFTTVVPPLPSITPIAVAPDAPVRRDPNTTVETVSLVPVRHGFGHTSVAMRGVPINVPTRGETPSLQQVGILTNAENDQVLPLYGRPTFAGSSKWLYHTSTDKFNSIQVPVHCGARNCSGEFGCDELYDGDMASVPAYNREFKVTIYKLESLRYIPYV